MSGDNLMTLNVYVLDDDIETHVWNVVGQQSSAWLQGSITIQAAASSQDYVTTCTFDMGQYSDMASILCDSLQAYAEACRVEGVNIQWRNETFCPLSCLANSHYTDCASLCPNTCLHASTEGDCRSTEACTEGCVCDSGFVLSDRLCVPQQDCGCWDHGNIYHTLGESWLTDNCSTRCRCMGPEDMDCNLHSCMAEESCALQNGQYKCQPVGFSTCTISGDPHYQTFDGLPYNFMGNNTYVLVQTSGDNPNLIPISVRGKNANRHGLSDISYLDEVHVNVFGHEIRFTSRDDFEFDGVRMRPPMFPREGLSIQQSSHRIILQTDFGLTVIYDRREHAAILALFGPQMTHREKLELVAIQEVWYFALRNRSREPNNDGYDDHEHHYIPVQHEHLHYRYEVLKKIGEGGQGQVIGCLDHMRNTLVAVKILVSPLSPPLVGYGRLTDLALASTDLGTS
ncbi:unnamed protein product [Lampetra fluviatilis]